MSDVLNLLLSNGSSVTVSPDEMRAALFLVPPAGASLQEEDIVAFLAHHGVTRGIDHALIAEMLRAERFNRMMTVAYGIESEAGEEGYFEFFFATEFDSEPTRVGDGPVDFSTMKVFEPVTKGQKICEYHKATSGKMGYTVTGKLLLPKRGKDRPAIRGSKFLLNEDGTIYTAQTDGRIVYTSGQMIVSAMMDHEGDLPEDFGPIRFDGDVHISGNVPNNAVIYATGMVIIDGNVGDAEIMAGKDVLIRGMMEGNGKAKVVAEDGDVYGMTFDHVSIKCSGKLLTNSLVDCTVDSEASVEVCGQVGTVIGGKIYAFRRIEVSIAGDEPASDTLLQVGMRENSDETALNYRRQLDKIDSELVIFEKAMISQPALRGQIVQAMDIKKEEKNHIQEALRTLAEQRELSQESAIAIRGTIHPRVTVCVNGYTMMPMRSLSQVIFTEKDEHISMNKIMA